MVDQQLTLEQAIEWCERRRVTVAFPHIHGHPRVQIRYGPAVLTERDTFLEAVQAADALQHRPPPSANPHPEHD